MNFTREPIIETIISPKDGCKLLVRSSRGGETAEEYYVDAIEVVSFGRAFFFRSMERPKPLLMNVILKLVAAERFLRDKSKKRFRLNKT